MNRRQVIRGSAVSAIASVLPAAEPVAKYAVMIVYYDRGAAMGFSLKDAVAKVREDDCNSPGNCWVRVLYVTGEEITINSDDLTRPTLSVEQSRQEILANMRRSLKHYESNTATYFGPSPRAEDAQRWRDTIKSGRPSDLFIHRHRMSNSEEWISDVELDAYEREHLSR